MKQLRLMILLSLLLTVNFIAAQEEEPVFYYKETGAGFEPIFELPHDTVIMHDTLYVSDIDALFWKYHQRRLSLNEVMKNYTKFSTFVDSVNSLEGERLFYNFFLRSDKGKLSNSFIIREFKVKQNGPPVITSYDDDELEDQKGVRREVLFKCEGKDLTNWLINNPAAILKSLSCMFTEMQRDPEGVRGINLYFPDFDFEEKRSMAQFVKTVRILMDASRNFKFGKTRLNVIFNTSKGKDKNISEDFEYCLMLEATDVIFIDGMNVLDDFYVSGNGTSDNLDEAGFFTQLYSHCYVARHDIGSVDILEKQLTNFSVGRIAWALDADYPENNWEPYMYVMVGSLLLIILFVALYFLYTPFAAFVYTNMVTVLIIALLVIIEVLVLSVVAFENMCSEDPISVVQKNPVLIFSLPIIVVTVLPILRGLARKRDLP